MRACGHSKKSRKNRPPLIVDNDVSLFMEDVDGFSFRSIIECGAWTVSGANKADTTYLGTSRSKVNTAHATNRTATVGGKRNDDKDTSECWLAVEFSFGGW